MNKENMLKIPHETKDLSRGSFNEAIDADNIATFLITGVLFNDIVGYSLDEYNNVLDELIQDGYLLTDISYSFSLPFDEDTNSISLKVRADATEWLQHC